MNNQSRLALVVQVPANLTSYLQEYEEMVVKQRGTHRIETIRRFYEVGCIPVPLVWPPNYNAID